MSLINDALKRAKQAHENLPPPPPTAAVPQFRPVEPVPHHPGIAPGVLMLSALCVLLLLGLLISWVWVQRHSSQAGVVVQTAAPAPPAETAAVKPTPAPAAVAATPPPAPELAPTPAAIPIPSPEPVVVVPVEAPPPPKPALKLQGIVYNPLRPAAMISGKTLFIGDKTGEWRVTAIDQESATLVSASHTNVLTLPQ
jgi:hypothetical protein